MDDRPCLEVAELEQRVRYWIRKVEAEIKRVTCVEKQREEISIEMRIREPAYPLALAKRFWLGEGLMVPVDEAEDADDESSS